MGHKRESGYMLVGTILAIVILSVVGLSLVAVSFNSVKTSSAERDYQAVYYIAEAGLNYQLNQIEKVASDTFEHVMTLKENELGYNTEPTIHKKRMLKYYELLDKKIIDEYTYNRFEPTMFTNSIKALIEVNHTGQGKYSIVSEGHIDNDVRKVQQEINIEWIEGEYIESGGTGDGVPEYALFAKEDIDVRGSFIVRGAPAGAESEQITTVPSSEKGVHLPAKNESGELIRVPELPPFPNLPKLHCLENPLVNDCVLEIKTNHELTIDENSKLDEVIIEPNQTITFIIDRPIDLQIERLRIGANANIKVETTNRDAYLNLHIEDELTTEQNSQINVGGKWEQMNVFYGSYDENKGKNPFVNENDAININASIYVKDANIHLGENSQIRGSIFSGGKFITSHGAFTTVTQLVLAPHATLEFFGSVEYYGMIIVRSIKAGEEGIKGGAITFTYVDCTIPPHLNIYHNFCTYPYEEPTGPISLHAVKEFNSGNGSNDNSEVEVIREDEFNLEKVGSIKEIN